jgi:hypothetical protein
VDLTERGQAGAPRHPWETARCEFFIGLLRDTGLLTPARWLDVGAGDAWLAGQLLAYGPSGTTVTCWDTNYSSTDLGSLEEPSLSLSREEPTGIFARVLLLDVVEHVEDDAAFLKRMVHEHTDPDSWVLVSVPAHQALFSRHDVFLRHYRRYGRRRCARLLEESGLVIEREGGLFHALALARAGQVFWERLGIRPTEAKPEGVGAWHHGSAVTWMVRRALSMDLWLSRTSTRRGRYLPGLSYWALCRPGSR